MIHAAEEVQNVLPTNMPFWCKDYSELKATEKLQTPAELPALTPSAEQQGIHFYL